MNETRYYANVADISQIPQALLTLVMHDWFDKRNVVSYGNKVDGGYVRIQEAASNTVTIKPRGINKELGITYGAEGST